MEKPKKKFIYLQNLLFLLFDEYIRKPKIIGEKVGCIIVKATRLLFGSENGSNGRELIRKEWYNEFLSGILITLMNESEQVSWKE